MMLCGKQFDAKYWSGERRDQVEPFYFGRALDAFRVKWSWQHLPLMGLPDSNLNTYRKRKQSKYVLTDAMKICYPGYPSNQMWRDSQRRFQ